MCKYKLPDVENMFKSMKRPGKPYHWVLVASLLICLLTWCITDFKHGIHYKPPNTRHFSRKSVFISGVEYEDESYRSVKNELAWEMNYACEKTLNDVVFAFQFEHDHNNRSFADHIFVLCKSHKVFGNGEIIHQDGQITCNEEYADVYKHKKRASSVTIKGINVDTWQLTEYESSTPEEACMIQHALDMLNGLW